MPRISVMAMMRPAAVALALAIPAAGAAYAGMPEFDFHGSLGPGKHTRYVPPLVNPLFNETPYITTEARPAYLHYDLPESFLTTGGTIDVYALELRLALTERLGIIASKDGYARADFDAVLPDEDGFANISIGLKYAVHSDADQQSIVSVGIEYEPPSGDLETAGISLQGRGKGFIDVFATGASVVQAVEGALEDVGGGEFVDEVAAAAARGIGRHECARDRGGGQALVPESGRNLDGLQQVGGKGADRLAAPAFGAVHVDR